MDREPCSAPVAVLMMACIGHPSGCWCVCLGLPAVSVLPATPASRVDPLRPISPSIFPCFESMHNEPFLSLPFLFVLSEPERITEAMEQANEISWSSSLGCESLGPSIHRDAAVASVSMGTYSALYPLVRSVSPRCLTGVCLIDTPGAALPFLWAEKTTWA